MNQNGDKPSHGGDRLYMAKHTDVPEKDILDFSVNVRPDGPLPSLMGAITRAINDIGVYPSPHAEEAMQAASVLYGLPVSSFVFGNGTTEIIRALCLLLKKRGCPCAAIPEPAFCEYASGWELTGLPLLRQQCAIVRKPSAVRPGDTDIDFRLPADWILSLPDPSCPAPALRRSYGSARTSSGSSTRPSCATPGQTASSRPFLF